VDGRVRADTQGPGLPAHQPAAGDSTGARGGAASIGGGEHPELGLSTVYRTLDLLHELGIVRKEDFGEGYSRYELATERMHHHARCRECGAVIEFNEELMEYLALQVERETGFVTDWHEITLHGRCTNCAVR
jgi:Fur family transcriptional regulator, ferric uptake regulator